jgi:hypothetical protein
LIIFSKCSTCIKARLNLCISLGLKHERKKERNNKYLFTTNTNDWLEQFVRWKTPNNDEKKSDLDGSSNILANYLKLSLNIEHDVSIAVLFHAVGSSAKILKKKTNSLISQSV